MATKGELTPERIANMRAHSESVIETLRVKNPKYGESWKSKGGFSAFFNLDRKWSRVETLAKAHNYDIFAAIQATAGEPDGMEEALRDLLGYDILILDDQIQQAPAKCFYRTMEDCPNPNCPEHGPHVVAKR